MYPGAFQVEFLVQHAEEVLDGEIAGCLQGHGSTGPCYEARRVSFFTIQLFSQYGLLGTEHLRITWASLWQRALTPGARNDSLTRSILTD